MKAMILAAGLGTRLKPWTLEHPKALVPVGGIPMLGRVITRLVGEGFNEIVVNVHHFADQIVSYLSNNEFGARIEVSDESSELLDTGGGILHAAPLLFARYDEPVLIHNVDILSNCRLRELMESHTRSGAGSTLVVSHRESTRHLVFNHDMELRGWHDVKSGQYLPGGFRPDITCSEFAFSGIYVMNRQSVEEMADLDLGNAFPVMTYFLDPRRREKAKGMIAADLQLIDIGKPATLSQAEDFLTRL